jgi:hypothetical protein
MSGAYFCEPRARILIWCYLLHYYIIMLLVYFLVFYGFNARYSLKYVVGYFVRICYFIYNKNI